MVYRNLLKVQRTFHLRLVFDSDLILPVVYLLKNRENFMIDFEISRAVKIWKDDSIVSEQDKMSEF